MGFGRWFNLGSGSRRSEKKIRVREVGLGEVGDFGS